MSYLIDGNNVMGQRVGWHKDKRGARRLLMDELAEFARIRKASVAVVFDGAPEQHFADGSSYRGVKVFYAERGSNADERIKRMVDTARERHTLKIITSDRELANYVRRSGVRVMRSGEFRRLMDDATTEAPSSQEEEKRVEKEDLPTWMRYFGVDAEDDVERDK